MSFDEFLAPSSGRDGFSGDDDERKNQLPREQSNDDIDVIEDDEDDQSKKRKYDSISTSAASDSDAVADANLASSARDNVESSPKRQKFYGYEPFVFPDDASDSDEDGDDVVAVPASQTFEIPSPLTLQFGVRASSSGSIQSVPQEEAANASPCSTNDPKDTSSSAILNRDDMEIMAPSEPTEQPQEGPSANPPATASNAPPADIETHTEEAPEQVPADDIDNVEPAEEQPVEPESQTDDRPFQPASSTTATLAYIVVTSVAMAFLGHAASLH